MRRYYIYLFYIATCIYPSIHLSIQLHVHVFSINLSNVNPTICLSIYLATHVSVHPIHPSIDPSIYLSIYLPQDGCIGVYGESERKFMFKSVIVGHNSKARFRIINSNKVRILDTSRQQLES